MFRPCAVASAAVAFLVGSAPFSARAEGPEAVAVVAPGGGGQGVLAARVLGASLTYRACAQTPCAPANGDAVVALPTGVAAQDVVIEPLAIGGGRHVLFAHSPSFAALLAAVPGSPTQARALWSGPIGLVKGEAGEQFGDWMEATEPEADKTVHVLLGEIREDVTICGRRSILSPRVLDAKDLTFKGARVQRLRRDERERAPALTATPSGQLSLHGVGRVLQGSAASSGIGTPAALTDGDLETTWSEKRGGDGNGEFVRMNAPEQVEITSISLVARPPTKEVPKGAAPRKLWLATGDALFAVTFAEDPWAHPGVAYEVKFPAPLKTACLSIVLDEAYVKGKDADVDVTLAEVTAHTEFDGKADPPALVGALAGGQARARMAAAILTRGGDAAYDAVIQAYPDLDDAGRVLALEIIDNAPCERSAPIYLKAMEIGRSGEVHHANDRLIRCQKAAGPALLKAIGSGSEKQKIQAAHLLSLLVPDLAVDNIVPLLPGAKPETRAEFRAALAKAAQSALAQKALAAKLSDANLPPIAAIDLLRAALARGQGTPEASSAFGRLATPDADFRTRYLLLAPAAELASTGDARAEDFVLRAVTSDADSHIRAHAAEVVGALPKAVAPLGHALEDGDVRVRDAALVSLAHLTDPKGAKVQAQPWPPALFATMAKLLTRDPFSFVRGHAADALFGAPAGEDIDGPLAEALGDASPAVRGRAIETLGRRGAVAHAKDIRERLEDEKELVDVRARAARALGRVCDKGSLDLLTDLARQATLAHADPDTLALAASAVAAVGRLNPPDLDKRLGPLAVEGAPRFARQLARSAATSTDRCH